MSESDPGTDHKVATGLEPRGGRCIRAVDAPCLRRVAQAGSLPYVPRSAGTYTAAYSPDQRSFLETGRYAAGRLERAKTVFCSCLANYAESAGRLCAQKTLY